MQRYKNAAVILLVALAVVDGAIWTQLVAIIPVTHASVYFLDVGQGDATLLEFEGGVRILTDAGPDSKVSASLEQVSRPGQRYIDLAVISHPELDHFNGFNSLLDQGYSFGAFITNGRSRDEKISAWTELVTKLQERRIPMIIVGEGDRIRQGLNRIAILGPSATFAASAELNDTGIVEKVATPDFKVLLAGDTGTSVEEYLLKRYDLSADILKASHHGSKYSSGADFLAAVHPALIAISCGAGNRYGHPAKETLERFAALRIPAFRTDEHGTISVRREAGKLKIFESKNRSF